MLSDMEIMTSIDQTINIQDMETDTNVQFIDQSSTDKILLRLFEIKDKTQVTLIEAACELAEELDIDVTELYQRFDRNIIDKLRQDALENNMVRSCVAVKPNKLIFNL